MKRILLNSLLFRDRKGRMPAFAMGVAFAFALLLSPIIMYGQNSDKVFHILGHVNNAITHEPVEYQLIYIESDSTFDIPGYFYAEVSTNENGFYKVSIPRPSKKMDFYVYTYDCKQDIHDTVLHISEGISSQHQKYIVDFDVCEEQLLICEPNFFFSFDTINTEEETYNYRFTDASNASIDYWKWDFGDGTETLGESASHTYKGLGVYEVQLTIASSDIFGNGCIDSITKIVNVGGFNYYYLAGQVLKPDYFPFQKDVNVYLYRIEGEEIIPVDTTAVEKVFGQNNEIIYPYAFHFLIEGDYIVKAQVSANSQLYSDFIPTYYGDAVFWEDAEVIHHNQDNPDYDINMVPSADFLLGEGHIDGNISFFNEFSDNQPALNVELVLSDSLGNYIKYNYSNEMGEFLFRELTHGKYSIQPDLTGVECNPIDVVLDEDNPVIENVVIVINGIDTNTSIQENESEYVDAIGNVYPNPAMEEAQIKVYLKQRSELNIMLYNQLGQMLYTRKFIQNKGEQFIPLNISGLPGGYYTLQVITADGVAFTTKLIKAQ